MEIFGTTIDTFISRVYRKIIEVLDNKADGIYMVIGYSV
jgi:hypothetical protein